MPFFGFGADEHVALRLVLQLAENPGVTATIVHYESPDAITATGIESHAHNHSSEKRAPSSKAMSTASHPSSSSVSYFSTLQRSLPSSISSRVVFESTSSTSQLSDALSRAQDEVAQNPRNGGDIIVVGRHAEQFRTGGSGSGNAATVECLGAVAEAMASSGIRASLLVVQASGSGVE
jgi:hypothetical protein